MFEYTTMAPVVCPVCNRSVPDIEVHIDESHSNPDKKVDGKPEADYIREHAAGSSGGQSHVPAPEPTQAPSFDPLGELGVKFDDFKTARVSTETGAALTALEAKRMFSSVENLIGFRFNRPAFIINLLDWGFRNGFTEELSEAGGFTIESDPTQAHREEFFRVDQLQPHIHEEFSRATGRGFTFRRFGRYLGPSIPKIVDANADLKRYYTEGTPISNRLGIPPQHFLCATSIFEHIKPYYKWTSIEKAAWEAHNRSVRKESNAQDVAFLPSDLRPSPSQATTMVHRGEDDFSRRHSRTPDYGKGQSIFEQMLNRQQSTGRSGVGFDTSSAN